MLQIFVTLVVVLTTAVVVIVYICLLPVKMSHSYFWGVYHLIFGHWILINIVFNYFKAAFTNPGRVPEVSCGLELACHMLKIAYL
jgi:palmitoyltransferase